MPEGLYPGDYLKDVGAALAARDGHKWHNAPEAEWLPPVRRFAIDAMMDLVRADLDFLGVHQEVFSSERALVEAGGVEEVVKFLEARDLVYTGVLEPPKRSEEHTSELQSLMRTSYAVLCLQNKKPRNIRTQKNIL